MVCTAKPLGRPDAAFPLIGRRDAKATTTTTPTRCPRGRLNPQRAPRRPRRPRPTEAPYSVCRTTRRSKHCCTLEHPSRKTERLRHDDRHQPMTREPEKKTQWRCCCRCCPALAGRGRPFSVLAPRAAGVQTTPLAPRARASPQSPFRRSLISMASETTPIDGRAVESSLSSGAAVGRSAGPPRDDAGDATDSGRCYTAQRNASTVALPNCQSLPARSPSQLGSPGDRAASGLPTRRAASPAG